MPYCSSCGNELSGDARFCANCGQSVPTAAVPEVQPAPTEPAPLAFAAVAPPAVPETPPPGPPVQQAYSPAYYPPPPPPPSGSRRSLKWVWIGGGAAAAVIIAIILVLVLVVFNGDDEDVADVSTNLPAATTVVTQPGVSTETSALPPTTTSVSTTDTGDAKGEAKEVEKVVREFFEAMEDQDWGKFIELMDPTLMGALPEGEARDAAIAAIESSLTSLGEMKFEGLKFKVDITSPTTATVRLTEGKAIITDASGNETTEDVKDAEGSAAIEMQKVDGKWYIASSAFM